MFFRFRGRQVAFACDRYLTLVGNLRALTLHLGSIRGQERWGVGTLEQAFSGYLALPPKGGTTMVWSEVLGVAPDATAAEIRAAWSRAAKAAHPDHGGSTERLQRVMGAWDEVRKLGLVG